MSVRSRFATRHKRRDWNPNLILTPEGARTMHDTDHPNGPADQPNKPIPLVEVRIGFRCPQGFEPAAFLIIGMTKEGQTFVNMPIEQPHLCLHLATKALDNTSQHAVLAMQKALVAQSPIVKVPPGMSLPPWAGPAGRG